MNITQWYGQIMKKSPKGTSMSEVIKGIGNNYLYAIGKLHFYNSRPKNVNACSAGSTLDITLELAQLELAFGRAKEELEGYGSA